MPDKIHYKPFTYVQQMRLAATAPRGTRGFLLVYNKDRLDKSQSGGYTFREKFFTVTRLYEQTDKARDHHKGQEIIEPEGGKEHATVHDGTDDEQNVWRSKNVPSSKG